MLLLGAAHFGFCLDSLDIDYWALQVFFSHDRALGFVSSCRLKLHAEQTDLNLLIWPMARQPISTPHNFLNNRAAEWRATQETHINVGFSLFLGFAQSKELEKYHQLYLTGVGLKTKQCEVTYMWEFCGRRFFRGQMEIYWVLEICSGFMVLGISLVVVRIFWDMSWLMITPKKTNKLGSGFGGWQRFHPTRLCSPASALQAKWYALYPFLLTSQWICWTVLFKKCFVLFKK